MGISEQDKADLDGTLKQLNLSTTEIDKFSKAFKDPEFIKLFEEYAKEVSDPKVKEETDLYLRQIEAEGRGEDVYGKGVMLVVPTEAFVVKTRDTSTGQKAFINICTSEKLDKISMEPVKGPDGKVGKHVEIPLSLSQKKTGADKNGKPAWVWDFVVHPDTVEMAHTRPAIKQMLVETAMEQIKGAHQVPLSPEYRVLNIKYKGTPEAPKPHVLSVRTGKSGGDAPTPGSRAAQGSPAIAGFPAGATPPPMGGQPASQQGGGGDSDGAGARSAFKFPGRKGDKAGSKVATTPLAPTQAGYVHASGEVTPQWEMIHRGQVDLTNCWGDSGRNLAAAPASYPEQLVLRMQLPGCSSAANLQLEVSKLMISVVMPGKFKLETTLPFPVDDTLGKAKFDKAKQQLEVVLPTLPPPLPPTQPARELISDAESASEPVADQGVAEEVEVEVLSPPEAKSWGDEEEEPEADGGDKDASAVGSGNDQPTGEAVATGADLTENQRRWAELHVQQQQQEDEEEEQGATTTTGSTQGEPQHATAVEEVPEFEPSAAWTGPRRGRVFKKGPSGQGYYLDSKAKPAGVSAAASVGSLPRPAAAPSSAPAPAAGIQLKPRLCSTLADDLD